MSDNNTIPTGPTRRETIKYGSTVAGGCLLAGCTGESDSGSPSNETSENGASTSEDESYSVTMSPVGTVEFDEVPERVVSFDDQWVDHLVALGQEDKLVGLARPDGYSNEFYEWLPGVSFDADGVTAIWAEDAVDMEILYELDADVHHIDPLRAPDSLDGLDDDDVETIRTDIGPFFANRGSRANNVPGGADVDYEFYTLWELTSKFAELYQVQDRSAALKSVRDEMVDEIQSNLPPEEDRPTVGLAQWWQGDIWVYDPNKGGFGSAHYRPVQLNDAFPDVAGYAASNWQEGKIDREKALDADPDVWIQHNSVGNKNFFENQVVPELKDDPVASQITAVQNDRIYPGGTGLGGPIHNLFQIEMTAKQVYPDLFGEYQGLGESIPEDEQLFDRQRVADIINGEI